MSIAYSPLKGDPMKLVPILMFVGMFLISCSNKSENPVTPTPTQEKGDLSFAMNLQQMKVVTNIQITAVKVKIVGPTSLQSDLVIASDSLTASGNFNNLIPGNYTITIIALSQSDTVATGQGAATVSPGRITTANFTLNIVPGGLSINVSWSFNTDLIVYARRVSGVVEIWKMKSDGTGNVKITDVSEGPDWAGLGLSPDRSKIAYAAGPSQNYDVYVISIDGTGKTKITSRTNNFLYYYSPYWLTNSRLWVSVARNGDEGKRDMIEINSDGTGISWITQNTSRSTHFGCLSPDKSKVVFDEGNPYASASTEVYIADYPSLTNKVQIANPVNPGAESAGGWNIDNLIILSVSKIYSVKSDGSAITTLSTGSTNEWSPQFSPNGSKILYSSNPDGYVSYYLMNADGNNKQLLLAGSQSIELLQYSWR